MRRRPDQPIRRPKGLEEHLCRRWIRRVRRVLIKTPGAVAIDSMFDSAEIMVDNNDRLAKPQKFAGRWRLGAFKSPALAGFARCAQFAARCLATR